MKDTTAALTLKILLSGGSHQKKIKHVKERYPMGVERHYRAFVQSVVKPLHSFTVAFMQRNGRDMLHGDSTEDTTIRCDALPGGTFKRLVDSLHGWVEEFLPDKPSFGSQDGPGLWMGLGNLSDDLLAANHRQFTRSSLSAIGVEFPKHEDWWENLRRTWQAQNYDLIKKLVATDIAAVNVLAEQAVTNGYSVAQLVKSLMQLRVKDEKHATLIARDQIGKLNGMVTQARMESIGLETYIWSTSMDERVRPSHQKMEGKLCRWDDASVYFDTAIKKWVPRPADAVDMHPGLDIQCRCVGLAHWEELVGEAEAVPEETETTALTIPKNNPPPVLLKPPQAALTIPKNDPPPALLKPPQADEIAANRIKELVSKVTTEQEAIELGGLLLDKAQREKRDIFDVMKEYREFGTTQKHTFVEGSVGMNRIEAASKFYPHDWVDLSIKDAKAHGLSVKRETRGNYSHSRREIALSLRFGCELHEMAHRMEALNPKIVDLEKEFYNRRTKNENLIEIREIQGYEKYEKGEKTRIDKFAHPYMGKDYGGKGYELLSIGVENLKTKQHNTDADYNAFIVGVLIGVK